MLNINNERLHIHNHSSYIIGSLPPSGWTVNCTSNKYMILFCHYHSLWSGTLYLFGKSFFIILGKTLWLQQLLFNRLLLMKSWYCMSWLCLCVRIYSDNVEKYNFDAWIFSVVIKIHPHHHHHHHHSNFFELHTSNNWFYNYLNGFYKVAFITSTIVICEMQL